MGAQKNHLIETVLLSTHNMFWFVIPDFSSTPSAFSTPSSASSANAGDGRPSVIGWTDTRPRGDGRDGDTSGSSSR